MAWPKPGRVDSNLETGLETGALRDSIGHVTFEHQAFVGTNDPKGRPETPPESRPEGSRVACSRLSWRMPDAATKLTPADPRDLADAIAFALRLQGL